MTPDAALPSARELFDQLLERSPEERETRLASLAERAPALVAEVRSLLAAHAAAERFLVAPAAADASAFGLTEVSQTSVDALPSAIGPWSLRERLGAGGMGEVWLAERDDGSFRRRVAIKLLRSEMHGAVAAARFVREREFLAALDHPNVARLLDGGVIAGEGGGRPYLVMELVVGERIDRRCDRMQSTVEERIDLFLQICAAVQHAHRNLIVHRDLKPANVLVTDDGQVKLLDFGIAKLLGGERDDLASTITLASAPALTPSYAAPEQIDGGAVTIATDVYALGVILYELLCGRRPYRSLRRRTDASSSSPSEWSTGWERLREAIRNEEPPAPSACVDEAIDGPAEDAATIAARRGLEPSRLRRRLAGDLDTIVLKAMRKDPSARYATVEALADDLRRHLDGVPVRARPATVGYRCRRFVRRNRVAVGVGAVVVGSLAVATGLATVGLLRAVESSVIAEAERRKSDAAALEATRQARAATLVLQFLSEDLIEGASIDSLHAYDVPLRELLEVASRDVGRRFEDDPALRASVELMIGRLFFGLSRHESAEPHLESAYAIRRDLSGATANERFDAAIALIELRVQQGRLAEAEQMLRSAEERAVNAAQRAAVANGIGYLRIVEGRFDDALPHLEDAVALAEAVPQHEALIHLANVAWAHHGGGRYDDAVRTYRSVLDAQRALHGPTHFRTLRTMNNLSHALIDADRPTEAEDLLREAGAAAEAALPDDHPLRLTLDNNLALSLGQRRLDETLAIFESVRDRQTRRLNDDHPDLLRTLNNIAMARLALGDHDRAVIDLREIHLRRTNALGAEHPSTIATLANVAYALYLAERYDEADPIYRATIELRERALGPNHPMTISTLRFAAGNLIAAGAHADAAELLHEALRRAPAAFGDDPAPIRAIEAMLSRIAPPTE